MKPIFVVGNSRSGTSMMGRILRKNPKVYTIPHEVHFFEELWDPSEADITLDTTQSITLLSRLLCTANEGYLQHGPVEAYETTAKTMISANEQHTPLGLYRQFLEHVASQKECDFVCEQTPNYLLFANVILDSFPDSTIINMVRDPRDILLSQKNKWRIRGREKKRDIPIKETIRSWANYHPLTMSLLWKRNIEMANDLEIKDQFLNIRYEDIVTTPEKTLKLICKAIGIDFDEAMRNIGIQGSSTSKSTEKTGVADFRGKWKKGGLSETELFICEQTLAEQMNSFGYDRSDAQVRGLGLAASTILFLIKTPLAVILNLGRTKNLWQALKRRVGVGKPC